MIIVLFYITLMEGRNAMNPENTLAASSRAVLSGKLTGVLDARTLTGSNRRLAELLTEGMHVLDVGCGTGAITRGIAEAVGPKGRVIGIDNNPALIEKAREAHGGIPGLTFETGDIYSLSYEQQFDIVTCARVLVWLSDPTKALNRMRAAANIGGRVLIADYNHEKIEWDPAPPQSMLAFYSAYLQWRADAGMNNAIADHLPELFIQAGLEDIKITPQHEITRRAEPDALSRMAIWAHTASSRGRQMEQDGYITEQQYKTAEEEYQEWIVRDAQSLSMYMLAVEGVRRA